MEQPHVLAVGALGSAGAQRIVGPTEAQRRVQVVPIAVLGKGARFAHQRPDDVAVVDAVLPVAEQARHRQQVRGATVDLQRFGPDPHQHRGPDQPGRHRVGVAQDLDRAEAADRHPLLAAQRQLRRGQRAQGRLLLGPAPVPGEVALRDDRLEEAGVALTVQKLPTAPHAQGLIDRLLEPVVGLLDVAVLVRDAERVGGRLHPVVAHQRAIAILRQGPSVAIERVDRRAQMIGAVALGDASELPEAALDPFDQ